MKFSKTQRGLSLIELMVAVLIGTLLLIGLVEIFGASRTAYQLSQGLARVQENGRFAMDFVQRDLRMAGHLGCINDQARFLPENDIASRSALANTFITQADQIANNYDPAGLPEPLRFHVQIQAYEAANSGDGSTLALSATPTVDSSATGWLPNLPAAQPYDLANVLQNRVAGSDILVLRYFSPIGAQMVAFTPGDPVATITFNGPHRDRLTQGATDPGLFGLADCTSAAVFNANTFDPGVGTGNGTITVNKTGNVTRSALAGLDNFESPHATLYRAESIVYYVGLNSDTGQPSLYRVRYDVRRGSSDYTGITWAREELVEGVESLQVRFGQDSRTGVNDRPTGNIGSAVAASALVPAANLNHAWRRVGLVQLGIVARSPDPAAAPARDAANPLTVLNIRFTPPNDTRYRTVYEQSIALRNRLFGN